MPPGIARLLLLLLALAYGSGGLRALHELAHGVPYQGIADRADDTISCAHHGCHSHGDDGAPADEPDSDRHGDHEGCGLCETLARGTPVPTAPLTLLCGRLAPLGRVLLPESPGHLGRAVRLPEARGPPISA